VQTAKTFEEAWRSCVIDRLFNRVFNRNCEYPSRSPRDARDGALSE